MSNFVKDSVIRIVSIESVEPGEKFVTAYITTSHFGRVTTKKWQIPNNEWHEVLLRGWIE